MENNLDITISTLNKLMSDENIWYDQKNRVVEMKGVFVDICKNIFETFDDIVNDKKIITIFLELIEVSGNNYYTSAFILFRSFVVQFILEYNNWSYEYFSELKKWDGDFNFAFKQWKIIYNQTNHLSKSYQNNFNERLENFQSTQNSYFKEREKIRSYCNKHAHISIENIFLNSELASESLLYLEHVIRSSLGMMVLILNKSKGK